MRRSDAAASRAGRASLAGGLVASALLALAGCVPLPPPLPTDEPTATNTLDVDRCPDAIVDAYLRELTGDPDASAASMRASEVDHPVPLPLGGADVRCGTSLRDGSAVTTLLVLQGEEVPEQVRGAAMGLRVAEDRLSDGGGWVAHAPDYTSTVLVGPPHAAAAPAVQGVADAPAWVMQALAAAP
ncbi:hypothetical protein FQ330_09360 [Agrococcus sediminis]|uniref:DUF3515 domain-containing protein n=1 Tax=Agrococcus sediminis TaxID=2599924 RepID=A0A5M8QA11_9MICO|nr:hypothetical protein [Agrococcus sediminis]KAA6431988.1 hypothetical protein FQ330_09360 [Agrococcus sediminis]